MTVDPYQVLEVGPGASEAELRAAYRRAVQRHHPDHNGGSPESARRFEAIQEAWGQIRRQRAARPAPGDQAPASDPGVESRLAAMERELREAREAGERAAREAAAARAAARAAASAADADADADAGAEAGARRARPSDEDLGYVRTEDSFGKILSDAREDLLGTLHETPVTERAADLLDEVARALRRDGHRRD